MGGGEPSGGLSRVGGGVSRVGGGGVSRMRGRSWCPFKTLCHVYLLLFIFRHRF